MTSREWTIALFGVIALSVVCLHLIGRRAGSPIQSLGQLATMGMSTRAGRLVTMACWVWVGWHLFVR